MYVEYSCAMRLVARADRDRRLMVERMSAAMQEKTRTLQQVMSESPTERCARELVGGASSSAKCWRWSTLSRGLLDTKSEYEVSPGMPAELAGRVVR